MLPRSGCYSCPKWLFSAGREGLKIIHGCLGIWTRDFKKGMGFPRDFLWIPRDFLWIPGAIGIPRGRQREVQGPLVIPSRGQFPKGDVSRSYQHACGCVGNPYVGIPKENIDLNPTVGNPRSEPKGTPKGNPRNSKKGMPGSLGTPRDSWKGTIQSLGTIWSPRSEAFVGFQKGIAMPPASPKGTGRSAVLKESLGIPEISDTVS